MTPDEKSDQADAKPKRAWVLPTLFFVFIVGTITFLLVIDSIYAPDAANPAALQDAVGK